MFYCIPIISPSMSKFYLVFEYDIHVHALLQLLRRFTLYVHVEGCTSQ